MAADVWPFAMITGHRPQNLDEPGMLAWVNGELLHVARKLSADHGTRTLISGLALGCDQAWGWCAIRLEMDLAAHIPFPQQPDVWRDPELARQWGYLRDYAECTGGVTVYGDLAGVPEHDRRKAAAGLLHKRNSGMIRATVAGGGVTVAVLRSSKLDGGTRSAYDKALAAGVPIIRIDPDRRTVTMANTGPETQATEPYEQETLPL